jgi:hypothetical protein
MHELIVREEHVGGCTIRKDVPSPPRSNDEIEKGSEFTVFVRPKDLTGSFVNPSFVTGLLA